MPGPLFKWFGSKWLSSKLLPAPTHDVIVEPFAGGAGYSLRYGLGKTCVLAESDPHLQKLWPWLIHEATEAQIRDIPIGVPEGTDIRTLGLSEGQALLLKSWQRTNNVGHCWTISGWGNFPGGWTANTRSRVAEEVEGVRGWFFYKDWTLVSSIEKPCTWFVDPPYFYNYKYGGSKVFDYEKLAENVRSWPGQKIVCEAECPKTGGVPDWLPFRPFATRVTSRRKPGNHHHSKELIWVSD